MRKLAEQFLQPLVVVLLGAAALSVFLGDFVDAAVITAVVVLNGIIGFFQEYRAEQSIAALSKTILTEATVLRDVLPADTGVGDRENMAFAGFRRHLRRRPWRGRGDGRRDRDGAYRRPDDGHRGTGDPAHAPDRPALAGTGVVDPGTGRRPPRGRVAAWRRTGGHLQCRGCPRGRSDSRRASCSRHDSPRRGGLVDSQARGAHPATACRRDPGQHDRHLFGQDGHAHGEPDDGDHRPRGR
jgi:hypothetical protein